MVSRITRDSLARTIYRPSTSVETSVSLHQRYRERSKDNGLTSKLTITLSSSRETISRLARFKGGESAWKLLSILKRKEARNGSDRARGYLPIKLNSKGIKIGVFRFQSFSTFRSRSKICFEKNSIDTRSGLKRPFGFVGPFNRSFPAGRSSIPWKSKSETPRVSWIAAMKAQSRGKGGRDSIERINVWARFLFRSFWPCATVGCAIGSYDRVE